MTQPSSNNHQAPIPCRVVVLISGSGSNLQTLIDGQQQGMLPISIEGVISNKLDVYGLQRAEQAHIPSQVVNHRDYDDRESFDAALANTINQYQPDLVVLAGFMRILTGDFVRQYQGRMLNIHPSLLPKYQGLHTHQRAIDAGDTQHGVTVHFVTEELDGGPNVIQAVVPIISNDTADSLATRVQTQEHIIYPMAVKWFAAQRLQLKDHQVIFDDEPLPTHGHQIHNN
ncbi:MAG: phosphoribosylglycinamide formyltransferase-1 [Candidatus Endobugula sp.]|jgi:phosphoribosylglycinamide formyltransferase-1